MKIQLIFLYTILTATIHACSSTRQQLNESQISFLALLAIGNTLLKNSQETNTIDEAIKLSINNRKNKQYHPIIIYDNLNKESISTAFDANYTNICNTFCSNDITKKASIIIVYCNHLSQEIYHKNLQEESPAQDMGILCDPEKITQKITPEETGIIFFDFRNNRGDECISAYYNCINNLSNSHQNNLSIIINIDPSWQIFDVSKLNIKSHVLYNLKSTNYILTKYRIITLSIALLVIVAILWYYT